MTEFASVRFGMAQKFAIDIELQTPPQNCIAPYGQIKIYLADVLITNLTICSNQKIYTYPGPVSDLFSLIEWFINTAWAYTTQNDLPEVFSHPQLINLNLIEDAAVDSWLMVEKLIATGGLQFNVTEHEEWLDWWQHHAIQASQATRYSSLLPQLFFAYHGGKVEISCRKFKYTMEEDWLEYTYEAVYRLPINEFTTIISDLITWFISLPEVRRRPDFSQLLKLVWETEAMALPLEEVNNG